MLLELHAPQPGHARRALVALAVVEHDHLQQPALLGVVAGARGERDLQMALDAALDEHALQVAVRRDGLGVEHARAAGKGVEAPRHQRPELRLAQRVAADGLRLVERAWRERQAQPGQASGDDQRQQQHRPQQPQRTHATGPDRGHFTLVVQPAQREHDAQQQSDRHHDAQVLDRGQQDQVPHHAVGIAVLGGLPEHLRDLVADQHEHQHERDGGPAQGDLAQDIAI